MINPKSRNRKLNNEQLRISYLLELMLIFLAMIFLSSCSSLLPVPQEMGNMALLRTFAVDGNEVDGWKVTVSTGKQAKGLQGEEEAPTVLTGESASLQGACRQLEGRTDHYVFYGYVDQLVVSTDLAKEGMEKVLEYFASNSQLSLGTGIWLTQGKASDLLTATETEGAEAYLGTIVEESHLGTAGITRKVGEILTEIREQEATFIPVLSPNSYGTLEEKGYGILKGDTFVSLLQGNHAKGLTFLKEHDQLLEVTTPQGVYALNLSQMNTCYSSQWDFVSGDHKLNSVHVNLEIQGDLVEYPSLPSKEEQEHLVTEAELQIKHNVEKTLAKLQELQADVVNIGGEIALTSPQHSEMLRENWNEIFPDLEIDVQVSLNLSRVEGF